MRRDAPGFGEHDAHVIVDLPDNEAAAAVARTTVLLTPEEMDAAAKQSVDYAAPGS